MFSWIGYAIFGLVAGALARMLHPGRDPMNWLYTMFLGIGGTLLGINANSGLMGWIAAVGGAVILLAAYHAFTARNAVTSGDAGSGPATGDDYKKAVFDDLSRGPR